MDTCAICQHPKKEAMNAALLSGRHVAVISRQFRLNPEETANLEGHKTCHIASSAAIPLTNPASVQVKPIEHIIADVVRSSTPAPDDPIRLMKQAIPTIEAAVRLADGDSLTLEKLRFMVNEALQSEHMGL